MNNKKLAVTIVIFCLSIGAVWAGGGTEAQPYSLTESEWRDGWITPNGQDCWFVFASTAGTSYNILWRDYDMEGRKLDIKIDAIYENGPSIFKEAAFDSPRTFISRGGFVLIKVYPYFTGDTGGFSIRYEERQQSTGIQTQQQASGTKANPIPLSVNTLTSSNITSSTSGGALWYLFPVINGRVYNISWRDADVDSDLLDIKVDASYQNGPSIFNEMDSAYKSPCSFTANRDGTVLLRVYPYFIGETGSFSIRYETPAIF